MNVLDFILSSNTLIGIGTVIFAVSYVIKNLILGNSKAEEEANKVEEKATAAARLLLETYEKQVIFERSERSKLQEQINLTQKQLGNLQGQLDTYKRIVENRSPELESTLKTLLDVANEALIFMKEVREGTYQIDLGSQRTGQQNINIKRVSNR